MRKKIKFEIITLDWKKITENEIDTLPDSPGIYQIYGTSPLYGVDTLLYIGQSLNLKQRVPNHIWKTESSIGRQPNKSIRFALLPDDFLPITKETSIILTVIEETLILMYKPSFNSDSLNNIFHEATTRPIYVQNHGERGMLNYENTNYYFLHKSLTEEIDVDNKKL